MNGMGGKSAPGEFRAEQLRVAQHRVIDKTLLAHGEFKIETHAGFVRDEMIASLTSYVLMMDGKRVVEEQETVRVPRSWWDHLKHDLLGGRDQADCPWWVRWMTKEIGYVVHNRPVIVKQYRVCPHVALSQQDIHWQWMAGRGQ